MPFAELEQPALGLSLLQAGLARRGVVCDVSYLNLSFAEDIGLEAYTRIVRLPFKTLAGDWIFSGALLGRDDSRRAGAYVGEILSDWGLSATEVDLVMAARSAVPSFLQRRLEDVAWGDYDVVGFTSYCAQTAASLAVARLVKERYPGIRVVVGGPNWRGVMGRELHRRFPFVDLVVDGEADTSFPALVEWLGGRGGRTLGRDPRGRLPSGREVAHHCGRRAGPGAGLAAHSGLLGLLHRAEGRRRLPQPPAAAAGRDQQRVLVGRASALSVLRTQRSDEEVPDQEPGARARGTQERGGEWTLFPCRHRRQRGLTALSRRRAAAARRPATPSPAVLPG